MTYDFKVSAGARRTLQERQKRRVLQISHFNPSQLEWLRRILQAQYGDAFQITTKEVNEED